MFGGVKLIAADNVKYLGLPLDKKPFSGHTYKTTF